MKKAPVILFFSLLLALIFIGGCGKKDADQDDVSQEKLKISKEVRDSLPGDLIYCNSLSGIKKETAKYGGSGTVIGTYAVTSIGPKWSPDGSKVAFIRQKTVQYSYWYMVIADQAGEEIYEWRLGRTDELAGLRAISWAPDGITLALLTNNNEMLYVNSETGIITFVALNARPGEYFLTLAWWPNGNKIAISVRSGDAWSGNIKNAIWMFQPYANDPQADPGNLLLADSTETITFAHMDWCMDGSMLAYSGEGFGAVYVVNADGTDNREIILKGIYQDEFIEGFAPCWAPNNTQIVFTASTGASGTNLLPGLFVTDIEGSYKVNIDIEGHLSDWY